jgi:hypothetical protein
MNNVSGMIYYLYFMNLSRLADATSRCGFYNHGEVLFILKSAQAFPDKL